MVDLSHALRTSAIGRQLPSYEPTPQKKTGADRSAPGSLGKLNMKRYASGDAAHFIAFVVDIAKDITAAPDRLDVIFAVTGER